MSNINVNLVRVNGSIDEALSTEAFKTAMAKYIAESETQTATIADAVSKVFDAYPGKSIPMPALTSFALTHLNAQPENHKFLGDRVMTYVRDNSQGKDLSAKDAKDSIWENPNSIYFISKGVGGGVKRISDIVAKPVTA